MVQIGAKRNKFSKNAIAVATSMNISSMARSALDTVTQVKETREKLELTRSSIFRLTGETTVQRPSLMEMETKWI